jgi:hypothetical protein
MSKKVLFTQWFKTTPEIQTYNLYCLYRNLSNPAIDQVVLFVENTEFENVFTDKLQIVPVTERLSYNAWFDYCQMHHPNDIKILINSDICLTENIARLDYVQNWTNTLYVVSRRDLTKEGNIVVSAQTYCGHDYIQPEWSQDCWIYKEPLVAMTTKIYLGVMHCENNMRIDLQMQGVKIGNLSDYVDCLHVDWRGTKQRSMADYKIHPMQNVLPKPRW